VDKKSKLTKKTVELQQPAAARPSRIRRDPVRTKVEMEHRSRNVWWETREWEIRLAIAGIIFFALGISAVVFDIGHLLGQ
jgi:hypothetical protein